MVVFIINMFVGSFKFYLIFGISQSMKPIRYSSTQQFLLNMMLKRPHLDVRIWYFPINLMPSILKCLFIYPIFCLLLALILFSRSLVLQWNSINK